MGRFSAWLYEKMEPYREWQDTLPFWKRLLVEVIGIIVVTSPFIFIIWWLTVGLKLITESIELWGFLGIIILFLFHIWMDYVWLYIVAFFASKSRNFLSNRNYKILVISLAIVLIYFGLRFLTEI